MQFRFFACWLVFMFTFSGPALGHESRHEHETHNEYSNGHFKSHQNHGHDRDHRHHNNDHGHQRNMHHKKERLPKTSSIDSVHVTVEKVWTYSRHKWHLVNSMSQNIDLMVTAQNAVGLLGAPTLPLGKYNGLYLQLSSRAYVMAYGKRYSLTAPPGFKHGLWLYGPFTISKGTIESIVLTFDPSRNIHAIGGRSYSLRPLIKIAEVKEKSADTQPPLSLPGFSVHS